MIHGIINIYKEKGFTSHDVVAKLRGITRQKKIGHTGTLDPDATGVLPVCLGKATKVCDLLTDKEKEYEALLLLGQKTDTQDISGKILQTGDCSLLDEKIVREKILSFLGDYDQVPPMYSALKVNGKKLYELARAGVEIERKSRRVHIFDIQIIEIALPRVRFRVKCSKGTYIRTLCDDIGNALGCFGCMESLQRTQVGEFYIKDSLTLAEVEKTMIEKGNLDLIVQPIDTVFLKYRQARYTNAFAAKAKNGNPIPITYVIEDMKFMSGEKLRVYDEENNFAGIYQYEEKEEQLRLVKNFMITDV